MSNFQQVQQKLQNKVFGNAILSRPIEIINYELIDNDFGEPILDFNNQIIVNGVALDYKKYKKKYDEMGLYNASSFILLLPHNTDITENSVISFNNTEFIIVNIDKQPFGSGFTHLTIFVKHKA